MLASVEFPAAGGAYLVAWIVIGLAAPLGSRAASIPVVAASTLALVLAPYVGRCVLARPGRGIEDAVIAASLAAAWIALHVVLTGTAVAIGTRRAGRWVATGLVAAAIDHSLRWVTPWGPTGATAAVTQVDGIARWLLPVLGASGVVGGAIGLATLVATRGALARVRLGAAGLLVIAGLPAPSSSPAGPKIPILGLRPPDGLQMVSPSTFLSIWSSETSQLPPDRDRWVLWPEGAIPNVDLSGPRLERVRHAAVRAQSTVFVGAAGNENFVRRNRLFVVPPAGPVHAYGKRTPFPVLEGVVAEVLGEVIVPIETLHGTVRVRVSLCFEGSLVDRETTASSDLHVNLASDVWLVGSPFARLHSAMVVVRALELGLPTVRHSDVGPSVVVDAGGVRWHSSTAHLVDFVVPRLSR